MTPASFGSAHCSIVASLALLAMTGCATETNVSVPGVEIYPSRPQAQVDNLLCVITNLPDDIEPSSLTVTWTVDDQRYDALVNPDWSGPYTTLIENDTVPAADVHANQEWRCALEQDGLSTVSVSGVTALVEDATESGSTAPEVEGRWMLSEPISYSCAIEDWFQFSFDELLIEQDNEWVWVTAGGDHPGTMSGQLSLSHGLYAERLVDGSCMERYQLDMHLMEDGTLEGTFTSTFLGSGCYDCSGQTWDVSAARR